MSRYTNEIHWCSEFFLWWCSSALTLLITHYSLLTTSLLSVQNLIQIRKQSALINCWKTWVWLPPSRLSSSLLLSAFCCCPSFFFNLKKTLSVESACSFFSSFVVHWWVHFPSSFPHVSTSPAVTRFFSEMTCLSHPRKRFHLVFQNFSEASFLQMSLKPYQSRCSWFRYFWRLMVM